MSDSPRILGLFAKQPAAGQVKTRLAAETSPAWAAEVATAFLLDLLEKFSATADQRCLVYALAEREAYFQHLSAGRYACVPQTVGDLGKRLESFLESKLQCGSERIVVVGSDSPTLPIEYVDQAYQELETADVVLGPATDGGYYLLGCARRVPAIFDGLTWGSRTVLAETIARLSDANWKFALLRPWYDVDTLDDWHMLRGHLLAMRRAGIDPGVARTEQLTRNRFP